MGGHGEVAETQTYADYFTAGPESSELRGQSASLYDEQGRIYSSTQYQIDPGTHTVGHSITSGVWYNPRGMTIKTADANGLFAKSAYDGAGRLVCSLTSFDADESSYAEAGNVDGDTVIQQSQSIFDKAGRPVAALSFQRFDDDATSTGPLSAANSYATASVAWFDQGNRTIATANYGHESGSGARYIFNTAGQIIDTNANGIPDEAESSPRSPNSSDDYLVSQGR